MSDEDERDMASHDYFHILYTRKGWINTKHVTAKRAARYMVWKDKPYTYSPPRTDDETGFNKTCPVYWEKPHVLWRRFLKTRKTWKIMKGNAISNPISERLYWKGWPT